MSDHLARRRGRSAVLSALTAATLFAVAAMPLAAATGPVSAGEYRTQANAICAREQQKTMSGLMGSKSLAQYLARELPVLRSALRSFRRLDPPATLSPLHRQVVAIVDGDVTLFSSLAKEASAGKLNPATWQNDPKLRRSNARELMLWKEIGAKRCASP
jgi:hypothetical protein